MRLSGGVGKLIAGDAAEADIALSPGQRADVGAQIPPTRRPHGAPGLGAGNVRERPDLPCSTGTAAHPLQYLGDIHLHRANVYIAPLKNGMFFNLQKI